LHWKTLLSDTANQQLTPSQAAALYASLYVRQANSFDQRQLFLVELRSDQKNRSTDKNVAAILPAGISLADLPSQWQREIETLKSTPVDEAKKMVVDLDWQKVQDRNLLGQRVNRSSALVHSRHFIIEADVPAAIIPELVYQCELTFALLEEYFDLSADIPPLWIRIVRNRPAYLKLLKREVQQIGLTNGYYDTTSNNVFCYWDPQGRSTESLRHELVHMILVNHLGKDAQIDWNRQSDFWAFEAIATYFESMVLRAGIDELCCMVGGWESPRLQPARYRRLHDLSWVPFEELRTMNRDQYQVPKDIQLRYSQSAGLAHYFMDSSPELQTQFIKYLASVHQGAPDPSLLSIESDESLRAGYDAFLHSDRDAFIRYPLQPPRRSIVLSRTDVQSSDLQSWPLSHRQLDWFDLSFTTIDGSWLSNTDVWQVKRWNLESTHITDADIANIVRSVSITELDLSNCRINDASVTEISKLAALKTLWLTGTDITDESLKELDALTHLETLDVQKTNVTQEAWRTFLKSHPKIRKQR
jgi:hypothetical protein